MSAEAHFCGATYECYRCTRLEGHAGHHKATWGGITQRDWGETQDEIVTYTTTREWRPVVGPGKSLEDAMKLAIEEGTLVIMGQEQCTCWMERERGSQSTRREECVKHRHLGPAPLS